MFSWSKFGPPVVRDRLSKNYFKKIDDKTSKSEEKNLPLLMN